MRICVVVRRLDVRHRSDLDVNFIKEKCMKSLKLRFINQFAACTLVLYLSEIYPEHCESLLMLFYDMLIGSNQRGELSEIVRTSRCWFRQVFVRQTHEFWCKISKITMMKCTQDLGPKCMNELKIYVTSLSSRTRTRKSPRTKSHLTNE